MGHDAAGARVLGIGEKGRKSDAMNDVRRRALRGLIVASVLIAPVAYYLWRVDYRGAAFPAYGEALFVAYLVPVGFMAVRSIMRLVTGKPLNRGLPWQLRKLD